MFQFFVQICIFLRQGKVTTLVTFVSVFCMICLFMFHKCVFPFSLILAHAAPVSDTVMFRFNVMDNFVLSWRNEVTLVTVISHVTMVHFIMICYLILSCCLVITFSTRVLYPLMFVFYVFCQIPFACTYKFTLVTVEPLHVQRCTICKIHNFQRISVKVRGTAVTFFLFSNTELQIHCHFPFPCFLTWRS